MVKKCLFVRNSLGWLIDWLNGADSIVHDTETVRTNKLVATKSRIFSAWKNWPFHIICSAMLTRCISKILFLESRLNFRKSWNFEASFTRYLSAWLFDLFCLSYRCSFNARAERCQASTTTKSLGRLRRRRIALCARYSSCRGQTWRLRSGRGSRRKVGTYFLICNA